MDVAEIVKGHYGGRDLEGSIIGALAVAGVDIDALTVADLSAVDELHAGGLPATEHLLTQLDLGSGSRLLDVGCGIGGPARVAGARGSQVTGIDLTPEFVATATALTDRVRLSGRVTFETTSAESLRFADGSFDRAMMIHVGMNLPDKSATFAEVRRVLRTGGRFGLFEQIRVRDGDLPYPLPWADDDSSSFVETLEEYVAALEAAGFAVTLTQDRTGAVAGPPAGGDARLGPEVVFGPDFVDRLQNNIAATRAGLLAPILVVVEAV
ncbi:MAG TPA: class I SAM-dependent methyltransferase [Candidatus Nanopelagicales bacterium]